MPVSDPLLKNLDRLHLGRPPADTDTPGQKNFVGKNLLARKMAGDPGPDTRQNVSDQTPDTSPARNF